MLRTKASSHGQELECHLGWLNARSSTRRVLTVRCPRPNRGRLGYRNHQYWTPSQHVRDYARTTSFDSPTVVSSEPLIPKWAYTLGWWVPTKVGGLGLRSKRRLTLRWDLYPPLRPATPQGRCNPNQALTLPHRHGVGLEE